MFEIVSPEHAKLNGYLIDCPQLIYWAETGGSGDLNHKRIQPVHVIRSEIFLCWRDPDRVETCNIDRLMRALWQVKELGFFIPDEVFKESVGN